MIPRQALGLLREVQPALKGAFRATAVCLQEVEGSRAYGAAAAEAAGSSSAARRDTHRAASTSAHGSGSGSGSGSGRPQQQQQQGAAPAPWGRIPDEDLPLQFSLRPSVLSPLHAVYRENQELRKRADFADLCLAVQDKLGDELDVSREDEVEAALAARRAKLGAFANAYASAARASPLPPPEGPEQAQGYMVVLEQQLADRRPDFLEFQRVLRGERDVWDYWFNDFAPRYEGLPGLAPLDEAFNRPSVVEEAQRLRRRALRTFLPDAPQERRQPRVDAMGRSRATGKRKTAVAQVFIWEGHGRILVNRQPLDRYFSDATQRAALLKPLMMTDALERFDVAVQVNGSGRSGQAQAAAHGIARALQNFDPAAYRAPLKRAGMIKRDPRMVERKKPGRAKARKSFAWVKR